ncbi:MAG: hypothetical protein JWM59_2444 [Verrucomicrobiales bacterium]|nr:hypothetical protein [Verrucomicrobiales bacterium]
MSRLTLLIQDAIRGRLGNAAKKTGFSETDLAKAFISAGLDQIESDDGIVIRAPQSTRPVGNKKEVAA